jgi:hypothetical protein
MTAACLPEAAQVLLAALFPDALMATRRGLAPEGA